MEHKPIIKLNIAIMHQSAHPPESKQEAGPSLQDKIDYAIECIDHNLGNKEEAIDFLQRIHNRINALPRLDEEYQILLDRIKPVLGEYGHKHSEDDHSEKE